MATPIVRDSDSPTASATSAAASAQLPPHAEHPGVDAIGVVEVVKILLVLGGLAWVFYPVFNGLIFTWTTEADWSHGPVIPVFSAFLLYMNWRAFRAQWIAHAWVGFVIIALGLLWYNYSVWITPITYFQRLSLMLTVLGVILALYGVRVLPQVFVPWAYLIFAIPLPKGIYFALTDPLRRIAATAASNVLGLVPSLDISRVGSNIEYFYQGTSGALGVADACSGMRSTITLCALGVAVAFMESRAWWQRVIMIGACVPIAIFSNVIRVTVTCWLHIFVDPAYARGTYHTALGLVTILIAFGIFYGLGWILNNLFTDVDDEPGDTAVETRSPAS